MTPNRLIPWLLGAGAGLLTVILTLQLTAPLVPLAATRPPVRDDAALPMKTDTTTTLAAEVETVQARPLFAPSRRPPAPAAPTEADSGPGPLPRLAGIFGTPRGRRALFQGGSNAKPRLVGPGSDVDGWRVDAIAADHVRLSADGESQVVVPKPDPDLSSPDPAAPPVGPTPDGSQEPTTQPDPSAELHPIGPQPDTGDRRPTETGASGVAQHP